MSYLFYGDIGHEPPLDPPEDYWDDDCPMEDYAVYDPD